MKRKIGKTLLLLPSLLWVGAIIKFDGVYLFLRVALAACFHECGHLLAFSVLGVPPPKFTPVSRGVRLVTDTPLSYHQEFFVAAAGPLANLFCFFIGLVWGDIVPWLSHFGEVSLMTALCNLVPVGDLDGDRIAKCLIAPHVGDRTLFLIHQGVNGVSIFLSVFCALLYLWHTGDGTYASVLAISSLLSAPIKNEDLREKTSI